MKKQYNVEIVKQPGRLVTGEAPAGFDSESLEVNVVFTEPEATAAALTAAESFARGLGAYIRVRAAIVVPMRLPLDQSPVSLPFMEERLRDLVGQPEPDGSEVTVHLYLCRDWIETLLGVLKPNSMVVIGSRKHRWPAAASRMARTLRARGHRVVVVDVRGQATRSLR